MKLIFLLVSVVSGVQLWLPDAFHRPREEHTLIARSTLLANTTIAKTAQTAPQSTVPYAFSNGTHSSPSSSISSAQQRYVGFNMVNSNPEEVPAPKFRTEADWTAGYDRLLALSLSINAVRLYSTTDAYGDGTLVRHLQNALPSAKKKQLSIVVGVWSGGPSTEGRFCQEMWALREVLDQYGCDGIAAVSVGNEDMYRINLAGLSEQQKNATKTATAQLLVKQIQQTQKLLDQYNCCNIPVTHTDTINEWNIKDNPWIEPVIKAVDSVVMVNIFPYWEKVSMGNAGAVYRDHKNAAIDLVKAYGKDVWIGETGWPVIDQNQMSELAASIPHAQTYFKDIGCELLKGPGSGFYYVDWDRDSVLGSTKKPTFGVFDSAGKPLFDLTCAK